MKTRRPQRLLLWLLLGLPLLPVLAGGCVQYEDDFPVAQTEILRVEVEPNPVAMGDTARFTVVIRDSLDERFRFTWNLRNRVELTEENYIDWVAELPPDNYSFSVSANNGTGKLDPLEIFSVTVVEGD